MDNGDGTVTRTFFPDATFRQDAQAAWQVIDPTVVPETDSAAWDIARVPGGVRPVSFGRTAARLIDLDLAGGTVSLSAVGMSLNAPSVSGATVSYPAADGTSLAFTSEPSRIKQAITIPTPSASQVFRFHLADPNGALGKAVPSADGAFSFDRPVADGVWLGLDAPVAYEVNNPTHVLRDAMGQVVPSATLQLTPTAGGFDVVEALNPTWLALVHGPVVLDPSATWKTSANLTNCLVSSEPTEINTPDCSHPVMNVGADATGARRMLLRLSQSTLHAPVQVISAA